MQNHFIQVNKNSKFLLIFSSIFLFLSFGVLAQEKNKEISKTIYFTANTGLEKQSKSDEILQQIVESSQQDEDAAIVILGNLTREIGYPKNEEQRKKEEKFLKQHLLDPLKGFNGNIIFTPGKNEWNSKGGHKNIDDLESFLQDNSEAKFWPNDGCPIEGEELSDETHLVMVDSQWYIEDWDHYPYINNKCEYKTRSAFLAEFKDELKDNQDKTIIVAVHHPIMSANRKGFFGRMGGFSSQEFYSNQMQALVERLETLASQFEDVIFVSGNHKNLQYLADDGIPQIISGATGKTEKTRPEEDKGFFGSEENGYAKLSVYKDGSSQVDFYNLESSTIPINRNTIKRERATIEEVDYHQKSEFGKTYMASVYTEEEVDKSGLHTWAWGDHYRNVYGKKIEVPVLFLDDLPANPKAISAGGGNQSRSLRLLDDNENEFTLREMRKSAVRFIQSSIENHYVVDYMKNTVAEDIVTDFYTTAHPYAPFAVNGLSKSLGILHANPKIYYVPKQIGLGRFNESYGDKLYMIEEHVGDENKDFETFGASEDILSTADMLLELQDNKDAKIDEVEYIKARIFDMLIGDWDRHQDQWRWAKYERDGKDIYQAIPRDRDQAFPKYDGVILSLLKLGVPPLRAMQKYEANLKNSKWFNVAGYPLDKNFIKTSSWQEWEKQALFIQNNLSDEAIESAFAELPNDAQDESIEKIKETLKQRRANLVSIAKDYYTYFKKFETVIGTNEDNKFLITRKDNGITKIEIREEDEVIFSNEYNSRETKEIWVYGLDGDDEFKVVGDGNKLIKLKILGGEENDIYDFERKAKTKVYDYRSKNNTLQNVGSKRLTDSYSINNYDPNKKIYTNNVILPSIGFDPDAGFKVGLTDTFTTYGLVRNPFTTQHTLTANYFSATQGFEVEYYGEFAHIFYNWNFGLDARITSPNYSINFFGIGNETSYDNDTDKDFNRVPIKQWHVAPSLIYKESETVTAYFKPSIESYEVDNSYNDFIGEYYAEENDVFADQMYVGAEVGFNFNNKGNMIGYPRRGMELDLKAGYKSSINKDYDNQFTYLNPTVSFVYPIHESGVAAVATRASANFVLGEFGEDYEFYHAATVGGNESLRGFRNDRFLGETSFFHSTDLRLGIAKVRTNFIPLRIGVTAGFDYGRVWIDGEDSNKWHNSYGGSVFINGFSAFTANVGYYMSDEDNRLMFILGFRF
ncbi:metallophosphatase [Mesonia ostreae]|uniref:Metallophosphatase n=1 Tax=Mesonia ostreae TaxID=861110 RepID=A0ABU2KK51_9FLAO|nr:metallophosphatase [Mesonia ostreae]MDT0295054.1 metallophosphatase [Mesonia ostreae]